MEPGTTFSSTRVTLTPHSKDTQCLGLNVFHKKKQGLDRIERIKLIREENLIRLCD